MVNFVTPLAGFGMTPCRREKNYHSDFWSGGTCAVGDLQNLGPNHLIYQRVAFNPERSNIYMGYNPKQSTTITTATEIAYAWAAKKASRTNDGVKIDNVLFVGDTGPGWSGGPVFNTNLEVVAVIVGHGGQGVVVANSIVPILEYEKSHAKTNTSPAKQSAPN
jgi:hypothetical protein